MNHKAGWPAAYTAAGHPCKSFDSKFLFEIYVEILAKKDFFLSDGLSVRRSADCAGLAAAAPGIRQRSFLNRGQTGAAGRPGAALSAGRSGRSANRYPPARRPG